MIELKAYVTNMLDIFTVFTIDIKQKLDKFRTAYLNLLVTKSKKYINEIMLLLYLI